MKRCTLWTLGLILTTATLGCDKGDGDESASEKGNDSDEGDSGEDGDSGGDSGEDSEEGDDSGSGDSVDEDGSGEDSGDGSEDGGDWTEMGVCLQRGEGNVTDTTYDTFEEFVLIGEEGFGDEICVVRFDVDRVGEGPGGCDDCLWTHTVTYSNPMVVVDTDGVCGDSELGLSEAAIAAKVGTEVSYGFIPELQGHASALMMYDEDSETWIPTGSANWEEGTGAFYFDYRQGFCGY